MRDYILKIRNQVYYETWEKYKNRLTMEDLAVLFNCPLKKLYRIIKSNKNK